jgi:UPF0716 protein FxsA
MFFYLLLLFISVPLIELYVIVRVNEYIGLKWTIIIIVSTGVLGSWLARTQGRKILSKIREELSRGSVPGNKIIEGLILLIGGLVLLFPGYITDFIGFMLMIPGNRRLIREMLKRRFANKIRAQVFDRETDSRIDQ